MSLFRKEHTGGATYDGQGKERKGLIDVIKYNGEEEDIVWKFPYENITTGAQLIVNQSQEAIFLKGGAVCDVFGQGTHTLSANNIPILQKLINLPFGGRTPFTAEVWYISKTIRRNLKFGTPAFTIIDPLYDIPVQVSAAGEYGIQVTDSEALMAQIIGTLHSFTTDDLIEQFRVMIVRKLTSCISGYLKKQQVSVVEINAEVNDISLYTGNAIREEFAQYGIRITNFDLLPITFDRDEENIRRIIESQALASSKKFEARGVVAEAQGLAAKRQIEGYSYQQERQFDVLEGAAQNEGNSGQMMGAGMGLGMGFGIGGVFGQQMSQMGGVMNTQPAQAPPPPPPPLAVSYHVLVNNVQQGPLDIPALQQMIQGGQITRDSYVWKAGMAQWEKAGECPELQPLFAAVPPPPPPVS
jgi:membrane protease subunit (stomatin/prohibitin family)